MSLRQSATMVENYTSINLDWRHLDYIRKSQELTVSVYDGYPLPADKLNAHSMHKRLSSVCVYAEFNTIFLTTKEGPSTLKSLLLLFVMTSGTSLTHQLHLRSLWMGQ